MILQLFSTFISITPSSESDSMIPSKESLSNKLLYDLMHIFCYSDLSGNKIAELPGSVFSKLAKLTNL